MFCDGYVQARVNPPVKINGFETHTRRPNPSSTVEILAAVMKNPQNSATDVATEHPTHPPAVATAPKGVRARAFFTAILAFFATSWAAGLQKIAQFYVGFPLRRIRENAHDEGRVANAGLSRDLPLPDDAIQLARLREKCDFLQAAWEDNLRQLRAIEEYLRTHFHHRVEAYGYQLYIAVAVPMLEFVFNLAQRLDATYERMKNMEQEKITMKGEWETERLIRADEIRCLRERLEFAHADLELCNEERDIQRQARMEDATRLTEALERIKVLEEDSSAYEADFLSERRARADDAIWFEYERDQMRGEYAELSENHNEALTMLKEWEHETAECETEWRQRHTQTEGRLADALERIMDLERVAAENDMNVALERGSWIAKARADEEKIQKMMAIQTTLEQHGQRLQEDMAGEFWRMAASRNGSGVGDEDTLGDYVRERAARDLERQTHEETATRLAAARERIETLERTRAEYESKMVDDRIKWSERGQRDANKLAELESANTFFVKRVQDAVADGLFEETELAIRAKDAEELDVERRLRGEINGYRKIVEELQGVNLELKKSACQARAAAALMTCCSCTQPEVPNVKASLNVPDGSGVTDVPDEVLYKEENGSGVKDEVKLLAVRLLRPKKPSRMRDTGTSTNVETSEADSPKPAT
ncbi:unnamed protein product [Cyclocybe aegerita]|uniref:Uncharacterized protein n=1 Tax=Cyclocybe aegerita TaxID=1973307 RepID=A0A8S0VR76_CYCAE|nr:unnamed protein product [Cyclocybe aegerita]